MDDYKLMRRKLKIDNELMALRRHREEKEKREKEEKEKEKEEKKEKKEKREGCNDACRVTRRPSMSEE